MSRLGTFAAAAAALALLAVTIGTTYGGAQAALKTYRFRVR